jgi:hypothetical protein
MSTPDISGTITAPVQQRKWPEYGQTIPERNGISPALFRQVAENVSHDIRVAMPGIVQEFDPVKQTVTVTLSVKENVRLNGKPTNVPPDTLLDVPVVLPRAGGWNLTFPIQSGDECLVVFADMDYSAWWQSGSYQNNQAMKRRHSISDGFAILGPWSQPFTTQFPSYSTTACELRSDDGNTKISMASGEITFLASGNTVTIGPGGITLNGTSIALQASEQASVSSGGGDNTQIDGISFRPHQHGGVSTGSGETGPVTA